MVTKASGEFLGHTICTDRTPGFSKTAKSTAESRWMPISMLSLSRNLAHGSIAANAFGSAPPPDVSLITYEDVLGRGRRNCPFSQATAPPWSSAPCGRYLRIRGGWNSTFSGHSGSRPWTRQLGGSRAYRCRLGKNRSPRHSRHSIASTKYASPPEADLRLWGSEDDRASCNAIVVSSAPRRRQNYLTSLIDHRPGARPRHSADAARRTR